MENSENSTLFVALNYAFGITGTVICSFQLIPQVPSTLGIIGYVPQYYEIYRRKAVCGISLIFLSIDMLGFALSALSLAFNPPPYNLSAALYYFSAIALDLIIIILYYFLNILRKKKDLEHNDGQVNNNYSNEELQIN
ncbi:35597_t:CDS:2 [Gigaspora margarita]|uniref:35597_t:CDS:1 n=1 Tax=Gigaspora margarita TaxID=4874 RepID=A0ABM8W6C9_GIGMA|nr:35597_t:CDS:2 [Gigaspora margarita]